MKEETKKRKFSDDIIQVILKQVLVINLEKESPDYIIGWFKGVQDAIKEYKLIDEK